MIKKVLPLLLAIIALITFFSYLKKNNQSSNKSNTINKSNVTDQELNPTTYNTFKNSEQIFLDLIEPENNLTVSKQAVNIKGKTVSNGYVFVNEQEFKADENGNFSTTVILEEGENYVLIVVSDDQGNSVEEDILVTLESTN